MVIVITVVQVQFLQYVVASAMEKDPVVACVPYRQEARIGGVEVTFSNRRLIQAPCLASAHLDMQSQRRAEEQTLLGCFQSRCSL